MARNPAVTAQPSARARGTTPAAQPDPAQNEAQQRSNEALRARLDPSNPNYIGPGYAAFMGDDGKLSLRIVDPQAAATWKSQQAAGPAPTVPTDPMAGRDASPLPPAAPLTLQQRLTQAAQQGIGQTSQAGYITAPLTRSQPQIRATKPTFDARIQLPDANPQPTIANPTAAGAPTLDRAKIDPLLNKVNQATAGIFDLAAAEQEYSQAQAQLEAATQAARSNVLGVARSGNARDRAMRERAAVGEQAALDADATRSAAILRAQEEVEQKKLRLDAYRAAGELGLNAGALEVDVNRLNMDAATNYLNQLFESNRLGLQLDQAEAERVTNFTRDMALIAKDYYALSVQEQQAIRDDLTRRYGINEQTKVALQTLDSQPGFWEKAALGLVQGASAGGAALLGNPAVVSDERAKTAIRDTTDDELTELLSTFKPKAYLYKDQANGEGEQFGGMAQDLLKSALGRGMVSDNGGQLQVHGGKAGMAALAATAALHDRLKALEASV